MDSTLQKHLDAQEIVISKFLQIWSATPNLSKHCRPTGEGKVEDLNALEYMLYESILHEPGETLPIVTALLSRLLVNYAEFEWHVLPDRQHHNVLLKHKKCDLIVPVYELCLFQFSSNNQIEEFPTRVYFDVLFACPDVCSTHPLIAASLTSLPGELTYEERYGYVVPQNIIELYHLYTFRDDEFIIRQIGLEAYSYFEARNWLELEKCISQNHHFMVQDYGKDWVVRAKKESNYFA